MCMLRGVARQRSRSSRPEKPREKSDERIVFRIVKPNTPDFQGFLVCKESLIAKPERVVLRRYQNYDDFWLTSERVSTQGSWYLSSHDGRPASHRTQFLRTSSGFGLSSYQRSFIKLFLMGANPMFFKR